MPRPQLLLLGDSLTEKGSFWDNEGWICLLLNRFKRSADVRQRGMGSYTTKWFMEVVVDTLARDLGTTLAPDLITLWLGANDSVVADGPAGGLHVPLADYKHNLHTLIKLFKQKAPHANVLLITPPAVDDDARRALNKGVLDRSNACSGEYARACVDVAHEESVIVLDLHALMNAMPEKDWKKLLNDGQHFTKSGNRLVEQHVVATIETEFPKLHDKLQHWEYPRFHGLHKQQQTWMEWLFGTVTP